MPTNMGENPTDLDELILLKNKTTIQAFESIILHCRTHNTMMMGYKLHVMTQATYPEDRANLPNGVYVVKTYTELHDGSCNVSLVLRNLMGKPVHLPAGRPVARVVAVNAIPDATPSPEFLKKLDEMGPDQNPPKKLTIEERQKLLLELLQKEGRLDKLKEWPLEFALKFERMLMEHHNIFSLEPNEIGCMDTAEHVIELLDTEPFKEWFCHIAPPLVEEVREHLQEMLDGGVIHPSQSPWCNAVVLVRKKDGGLRFCIDFCRLNSRTKKDAYPLPQMQETMESMVGAQFFFTMDLKSGFWQVKMAKDSQQYTAFMMGSMGVYEFLRMPYRLCNDIPEAHAKLPQRAKLDLCPYLPGRLESLLPDWGGAPPPLTGSFWPVPWARAQAKTVQMSLPLGRDYIPGPWDIGRWDETGYGKPQSNSGNGSTEDIHWDTAFHRHDWLLPAFHQVVFQDSQTPKQPPGRWSQ